MQMWQIYLHSDFRYGPDNHTLCPQPYLNEYPHLGAIPMRPEDPEDPLSIMWWNPTLDDFELSTAGILDVVKIEGQEASTDADGYSRKSYMA